MSSAESMSPVYRSGSRNFLVCSYHAETFKGDMICKIYAGMSYRFTCTSALLLGNRLVMDRPDINT